MLEVICYKKNEDGNIESAEHLQISPDTQIDIIWENPLFMFDEISVSFSISFAAPANQHNLRIFNFPDRVPVFGVITKIPAAIKHSGITILEGEILLSDFDKQLNLQFKGSTENIDQELNLNDLELGEKEFSITYPDKTEHGSGYLDYSDAIWDEYVKDALKHSFLQDEEGNNPQEAGAGYADLDYYHAPVKVDEQWEGQSSIGGVHNAIRLYHNFLLAYGRRTNPTETPADYFTHWINSPYLEQNWPHIQWHEDHEEPTIGDPKKRWHTPVVPFIPLYKIINAAMKDTLTENPFETGDFKRLLIIGGKHPNNTLDFIYQSFAIDKRFYTFTIVRVRDYGQFSSDYQWRILQSLDIHTGVLWKTDWSSDNDWGVLTFKSEITDAEIKINIPEGTTSFTLPDRENWEVDNLQQDDSIVGEYEYNEESTANIYYYNYKNDPFFEKYGLDIPRESIYFNRQALFPISESDEGNIKWKFKSFMQEYQFNEFFKDILKIFGMTLFRGIKSFIEYNDDVMDRQVVVSWDEKLDGELIKTREEAKVYSFEFAGESKEKQENIKEFNNWNEVYWEIINNQPYAAQADAEDDNKENEFFYKIAETPQVIAVKKELKGVYNRPYITSRIVNSALATSEKKTCPDKIFSVQTQVKPLNMNIEPTWHESEKIYYDGDYPDGEEIFAPVKNTYWHVPVMNKQSKDDAPHIMLISDREMPWTWPITREEQHVYGQHYPNPYPYLTNHNKNAQGENIANFSLIPEADNGLLNKFHSRMKSWVEKPKLKIRGNFLLSALDLKELDMRDKIHIKDKLFYIKSINYSLTNDKISKSDVTLIEV